MYVSARLLYRHAPHNVTFNIHLLSMSLQFINCQGYIRTLVSCEFVIPKFFVSSKVFNNTISLHKNPETGKEHSSISSSIRKTTCTMSQSYQCIIGQNCLHNLPCFLRIHVKITFKYGPVSSFIKLIDYFTP